MKHGYILFCITQIQMVMTEMRRYTLMKVFFYFKREYLSSPHHQNLGKKSLLSVFLQVQIAGVLLLISQNKHTAILLLNTPSVFKRLML